MRKYGILFILLTHSALATLGQVGGQNTFEFLNLPVSARIAAMGGNLVSIWDDDLNLTSQNPALLNSSMSDHFNLNYVNYFAGINFGSANIARTVPKFGNFSAGCMYVNYGDFDGYDELGVSTGTFTGSEVAINLMWSMPIDSVFQFGANMKIINSTLETYFGNGAALDLGLSYHNPSGLFAASVVLKNMGYQFHTYYAEGNHESLPFEIEAGFSKKLRHAPFRFTVTLQHLEQFDLSYESNTQSTTTIDPLTGDNQKKNKFEDFGKKAFNHLVLATEFVPSNNFYVMIAYNAQRRSEMKIENTGGAVGFSWGLGMKVSKFRFSFGRARYHIAGGSNHFSISTNLADFYTRG
ncbi:MAG: type IX secretion system protein PorQ [Bacteroidales bacterium]|nr:type IX secretion system protein PorQ [Bacteroidales bacterium]MCF8458095.1 type IX secretion system protein PorQ [Bacteroidales bacterium]